jgi:hypothetical protein
MYTRLRKNHPHTANGIFAMKFGGKKKNKKENRMNQYDEIWFEKPSFNGTI